MTHLAKAFDRLAVGESFTTAARTVTEADVLAFAAQTGDAQPVHVDEEGGKSSVFGERVAHGMLTLSYAFGLLQLDPGWVLALRRIADVVFARPVRIGDTIRVEGRVAALSPRGEGTGAVTLRLDVRNQHGQIACRANLEMLWVRESAGRGRSREAATGRGEDRG